MSKKKADKKAKPHVIELSVQTQALLQQLSRQIAPVQQTIQAIIQTVIAEKGDSKKGYVISGDVRSLVERVAE